MIFYKRDTINKTKVTTICHFIPLTWVILEVLIMNQLNLYA
jgi:hypothetical protein